jgi:diguanylate cyclase (GGDEF)-like protein/PAS domain S-box-containing protein
LSRAEKFRNILFIFSIYILAEYVLFQYFYYIEEIEINKYTDSRIDEQYKQFQAVNDKFNSEITVLLLNNFQKPEVITALSLANRTEDREELSKYREELYKLFFPLYKNLLSKSFDILHFHLPDATSFLRMHKPIYSGDKLSYIRKSVVKTQSERSYIQGYEIGRHQGAFRNIIPLYDGEKLIGSVEVSYSEEKLIDRLQQKTGNRYSFLLIKDEVDAKIIESDRSIYSISQIGDNFVSLKNREEGDRFHQIDKKLRKLISISEINSFQPFAKYLKYRKTDFIISFIPFKDFNGRDIGYMVEYKKDSRYSEIRERIDSQLLFFSLFLISVFIFIVKYFLKSSEIRFQKRYLKTVFNAQQDIVIITAGRQLSDVNSAFLKFFGYETMEDFFHEHKCVCELLEKVNRPDYIYLNKYRRNWLQTILNHPEIDWKGEIIKENHKYIFSIKATQIHLDEEDRSIVTFSDITALIEQQEYLERRVSERTHEIVEQKYELIKYKNLVDENVIISSTDKNGFITHASEAFIRISGFSREELIGSNHNIVRHPKNPKSFYKKMWETIERGDVWRGEIRNRCKNGEIYWVQASIYPNYNKESGEISGYTAIRHDITDKKNIEELSITDPLTGLFNRRYFSHIIKEEMENGVKNHISLSFVLMDIDNFKKYNDNYGHHGGDEVLKSVSNRLQKECENCNVFRLGGEEFGAIYTDLPREKALKLTEKLRKGIEELKIEHKFNEEFGTVTASFGLCFVKELGDNISDDLYRLADKALYKAKESGRNRVEVVEI